MWPLHFIGADKAACSVVDFMLHLSALADVSDIRADHHLTRILRPDGQVAYMRFRHSHQRHIPEDAIGRPVVIIIEIAATELRDDTESQCLRPSLLVNIGRNVEDGGVIARAPCPHNLTVHPQVIAI